ncbi:dinuclear metal center YbgI/SA1388 family protein [Anaerospora hongkongensis]|uniref:GTP cyclohydrolase 1 type 2 homolog n=1 Tax=Anaerospora hongkongensis TaxID=244830 RepID=A0A4R1PTB5_9FIRM|nr:Nif3-like dinuclear metal center hexameric protein [Anaerospora hongkongensis]TCL35012.1 dinuclear metal center YbgI/SA1388 family protein [Anaerospora hongkongensis]
MSISCKLIMEAMEKLAPTALAEKWDNVGLLIGSPEQEVNKVLVTLDVTLPVVRYAAEHGYELIISHHPVIFKSLSSIRTDTPQGEMLAVLLQHSIAVYCTHTNLDIAAGGVNDALAACLQLQALKPLQVTAEEKFVKLVVFAPVTHMETVREAICQAGAGHIGNYSHCTFQTAGMGTFLPLAGTKPFIGEQGRMEYVQECRLETIFPESLSKQVVAAMIQSHPYEEVAYDLYSLANNGIRQGLGRLGRLSHPRNFTDFIEYVKSALGVGQVTVAGNVDNKMIEKVAICGGSGASLINCSIAVGADVLITGDIKYHEAQEAAAKGLIVVDAGHFATEQPVLAVLTAYLQACSETADWHITIQSDAVNQDIFQCY